MTCSARSFSSASRSARRRPSSAASTPRGRVPASGRVSTLSPSTRTSGSGERADERHVGRADVEHVRARVDGAEHAVEVEAVALVRGGEALREHDLEDVARGDVLLRAARTIAMNSSRLVCSLQRHLGRHAHRRRGAARPGPAREPRERGVDARDAPSSYASSGSPPGRTGAMTCMTRRAWSNATTIVGEHEHRVRARPSSSTSWRGTFSKPDATS